MAWQIALAVVPIVVSAFFAWRAQQASSRAERLQLLEERLAVRKFEVYEPLISFFAELIDPRLASTMTEDQKRTRISTGATWIAIFGSDAATTAFQRFMQCTYAAAPPYVLIRAYADFVLAARVDMGHPDTKLSALDLMGMRFTEAYTKAEQKKALTLPFEELCDEYGWTPPWKRTPTP